MSSSWPIKSLGDVLVRTETVDPGQSPESEFEYVDVSAVSNETFQITETQRLQGKDAPSRARRLIRRNDVLFATVRPTLQRVAVVPAELDRQVCSTGYFVMRPKPELNHRWLFYSLFTESFMGQMAALQKGASYPAVNDSDVRAQGIPIPPLAEQQRIVSMLDEAFAAIAAAKDNTEKNLSNARAVFASASDAILAGCAEASVIDLDWAGSIRALVPDYHYRRPLSERTMPITLTFDIEQASIQDPNDRNRIIACFTRLGWEHIGGSAWRYPAMGSQNVSEDWFNHVIPALMYFRSLVDHGNLDVYNFTIDAHSEAGHRGRAAQPLGQPIAPANQIVMYPSPSSDAVLSEARLQKFITDAADSLG